MDFAGNRPESCSGDETYKQPEQKRVRGKRVVFYCGYLSAKNSDDFLPPALVSAMCGTVQDSENRIARLLFKMTVELSMMMNVLAVGLEINADDLDRLRGQCVRDVKKSNGSITFKDTVAFQNGR